MWLFMFPYVNIHAWGRERSHWNMSIVTFNTMKAIQVIKVFPNSEK